MAINIELKAKVKNIQAIETRVQKLTNSKVAVILLQQDVYYKVPYGRLKLRKINDETNELIFYFRKNTKDLKESKYFRFPISSAQKAHSILKLFFGIKTEIIKERKLYFLANTRIHIDSVKNLGNFVEFEYVADKLHEKNLGFDKLSKLLNKLKISQQNICKGSYADLMNSEK